MAVLTLDGITDLANTTLSELGRFRMVDLTTDLREHVAMSRMMSKKQVKISSGDTIKWNALEYNDTNAKNTGAYGRDNTNVKDGTLILEIPWRHSQTSCAFDISEAAANRSPSKIVDFVKTKRQQSMGGFVELLEANFWQGAETSTDTETPFGIFGYWADYNSGTTADFNGTNGPYGSIGGQDADVHTKLKHMTYKYTNVSDTDLVDGLRDCLTLSRFKPVVKNAPVGEYGGPEQREMCAGWTTVKALEKLARQNNDNLGADLDMYHGKVRIQGVAVNEVPYITENKTTSYPVVGLDWGQFHTCILRGMWMKQRPFKEKEGQHTVQESFTDCWYNFRCYNRRKGIFLAAKSDPQSS